MAKKNLAITATYLTDHNDDAFWRVSVTEDGMTTSKVMAQDTFANTLKYGTIVRKEQKSYRLGKLPFGYVDAYVSKEGSYKVAVLYPKKKRGVKYYKDNYFVPYPNTLYIYEVKNGICQMKRCFAVRDKDIKKNGISESTPLYHFPFGNVYENGNMCYGGIKMPDLKHMGNIDTLVSLFLNGGVNDDLYTPARCTTLNKKQYEVYRYLESKEVFPDKILNPMKPRSGGSYTFGMEFY